VEQARPLRVFVAVMLAIIAGWMAVRLIEFGATEFGLPGGVDRPFQADPHLPSDYKNAPGGLADNAVPADERLPAECQMPFDDETFDACAELADRLDLPYGAE
jgi:hypothetical protein